MENKYRYYTLDEDKNPIGTNDIREWGKFFESGDMQIALTNLGKLKISTIFLGIDHNFTMNGPPILWATIVFNEDGYHEYHKRYESYEKAIRGHCRAILRFSGVLPYDESGVPFDEA